MGGNARPVTDTSKERSARLAARTIGATIRASGTQTLDDSLPPGVERESRPERLPQHAADGAAPSRRSCVGITRLTQTPVPTPKRGFRHPRSFARMRSRASGAPELCQARCARRAARGGSIGRLSRAPGTARRKSSGPFFDAEPEVAASQMSLASRSFHRAVVTTLESRRGKRGSSLEVNALTLMTLDWLTTATHIYLVEGKSSLVKCFDEVVAVCAHATANDLRPLAV